MKAAEKTTDTAVAQISDAFFDCVFAGNPLEILGSEPYCIFIDAETHPFTVELIKSCRGEAGFGGVFNDIAQLPPTGLVFCGAPLWSRRFEALRASGIKGDRARVLLHFDVDPTGYWDFGLACGKDLQKIFRDRGVDAVSVSALTKYLELWAGSRISNGRLLPYANYYTRDYLPLQIEKGREIARVLAAMADDESRAAYVRVLFGTNEQVVTSFTKDVFGGQQYMEIVKPQPGDVIINCGVGRGWELPYFLCGLKGKGAIHNIDPNMQFEESEYGTFIARFKDIITNHKIIAGDQDGSISLTVHDSGMINSGEHGADGDGRIRFKCRQIDSMMEEGLAPRIDFLKMDVEGGERTILKGALKSIKRYRPKLAVAIYHDPNHFWEYPCFLLDNLEDYRFYLRQYGYTRFETLLYAIPAEATITTSGTERMRGAPTSRRVGEAESQYLVTAYFRDNADAPRDIHPRGDTRVLTRMFGVDWETAAMSPGPWINTDEVFGVVEGAESSVIFCLHENRPNETQMVLATSRNPSNLAWTVAHTVHHGSKAMLLAPQGERGGALLYDPKRRMADLYEFDLPGLERAETAQSLIRAVGHFHVPTQPLLARWKGKCLNVLFRDEAGQMMELESAGESSAQIVSANLPAGDVLGQVALKLNGVTPAYLTGLAIRQPGAKSISIFVDEGESFRQVAEIAEDARLSLLSTFWRGK